MKTTTHGDTISLGEVTHEEINMVSSFFDQYWSKIDLGSGVLIRCESGRRVWQITDSGTVVTVYGGECAFDATYLLSYQFIANCRPFLRSSESIMLSITGHEITASSKSGTLTMRCNPADTVFKVIDQLQTVRAQIQSSHLYQIVDTATYLQRDIPARISLEKAQLPESPTTSFTSITINHETMTLHTTWNPDYGLDDVTATIVAKTIGTGTVNVSTHSLNRMSMVIGLKEKPEFTVSFDPASGDFVVFSSSTLRVALRRAPMTVHQ